jgi:hypothetical protein
MANLITHPKCHKDKKNFFKRAAKRNPLSSAQGKVTQVKIMLRPSSFDKDERATKRRIKLTPQVYS